MAARRRSPGDEPALVVPEVVQEFAAACAGAGTQERAEFEQRYLKTELAFFGVTVPFLRQTSRRFLRVHPDLSREQLLELVAALFESGNHNLCQLGALLVVGRNELLRAGDARFVIDLVQRGRTWAIVDMLAIDAIGPLVERFASVRARLPVWARSDDLWVRRTALLAHLKPLGRGEGDLEGFAALAASPLLDEREFFVQKAIGWVLRETGKRRPRWAEEFVAEHLERMGAVTFREAIRHLPEAAQRRLKTAR